MTESEIILKYLKRLTCTQGHGAGSALKLFKWQRDFINGGFTPEVHKGVLSVARGAGKSGFLAAVATAFLDEPKLRSPRAEIPIVAATFTQGRILFDFALAYLLALYEVTELTSVKVDGKYIFRVQDTANNAAITHKPSGCKLFVRPGIPGRLHGLQPKIVFCDEPAQWDRTKSEGAYSALKTALGKIPQSRLFALGTRAKNPGHWFSQLLETADFSMVFAAAEDDPIGRRSTWIKANPSVRRFKHLEQTIRSELKEAKADPASLASFRALRLNLGTSDVQELCALSPEAYKKFVETDQVPERLNSPVIAFDLSGGAAMVSASAYWPESYRLEVIAAFPEKDGLAARGLLDGCGNSYIRMHERGELLIMGKHIVPTGDFVKLVCERWGNPRVVAFDRFKANEMREALGNSGIPVCDTVERGVGFRDGGEDYRKFLSEVLNNRVKTAPSLLLRSAFSEARIIADASNGMKLCKASEGGRRLRGRDDAVASSLLAIAVGSRRRLAGKPKRRLRRAVVA